MDSAVFSFFFNALRRMKSSISGSLTSRPPAALGQRYQPLWHVDFVYTEPLGELLGDKVDK